MVILGIDPGSRFLGYAVLKVEANQMRPMDYGVLKFDPQTPLSQRLEEIGLGVRELFSRYKPQHLSLEKLFLGKNADSAFKMGHARGVVIYESLLAGCEVHEYATRAVKKGITGSGGADKEHVRLVVRNMLQIGPVKSLDASDALAMACYHATQLRVLKLRSERMASSEKKVSKKKKDQELR